MKRRILEAIGAMVVVVLLSCEVGCAGGKPPTAPMEPMPSVSVAVFRPFGCNKSTLLRVIASFDGKLGAASPPREGLLSFELTDQTLPDESPEFAEARAGLTALVEGYKAKMREKLCPKSVM